MTERDPLAAAPAPDGFLPLDLEAPFAALIGPLYEKVEGERFWRGFRVLRKHTNRAGIAHGGMLTTFADILLATAIWRAGVGPAVTVRLVADFAGPVRAGDWVEGTARLTRATASLVFVDGAIAANGRAATRASGVFQRIRRRP